MAQYPIKESTDAVDEKVDELLKEGIERTQSSISYSSPVWSDWRFTLYSNIPSYARKSTRDRTDM